MRTINEIQNRITQLKRNIKDEENLKKHLTNQDAIFHCELRIWLFKYAIDELEWCTL